MYTEMIDSINLALKLPKIAQGSIIVLSVMLLVVCSVFWFFSRKYENREGGS